MKYGLDGLDGIQFFACVNGREPKPMTMEKYEVAPPQDTSVSKQVKRVPKSPTITLTFDNPFPTSSPTPEWAKATIIGKADWFRNIAWSHWKNALNNN